MKTPINKLLALSLVCLSLLSACVSSQPVDPDAKTDARKAAESNTQLGLEYMNRGKMEIALGKLKKAVRDDPDYAPGHTVIAVLYQRLGEDALAGKHYQLAFEADPKNGDVNNNYGIHLCQAGKYQQAILHFLKALDDPFYRSPAVALTNAASCALRSDKLSDADNYLRRALQYDASFPDALLTMANLNQRQQNHLRARAFLQRFEAATGRTAESLLLGYEIETSLNDDKMARQYLSWLNSQFPGSKEAEAARRIKRT